MNPGHPVEPFAKLARMLRTRKLLVAFAAALVLLSTAAAASARGLSSPEASLLHAINAVRAGHGLAQLHVDSRLESVARNHSSDMLRRQYFAHAGFAVRMHASGAQGPVFGEDLAWGPASAQWVISHWLASPEHRANLLRPGFRRIGIGAVIGTFDGYGGALVTTADFAGS